MHRHLKLNHLLAWIDFCDLGEERERIPNGSKNRRTWTEMGRRCKYYIKKLSSPVEVKVSQHQLWNKVVWTNWTAQARSKKNSGQFGKNMLNADKFESLHIISTNRYIWVFICKHQVAWPKHRRQMTDFLLHTQKLISRSVAIKRIQVCPSYTATHKTHKKQLFLHYTAGHEIKHTSNFTVAHTTLGPSHTQPSQNTPIANSTIAHTGSAHPAQTLNNHNNNCTLPKQYHLNKKQNHIAEQMQPTRKSQPSHVKQEFGAKCTNN